MISIEVLESGGWETLKDLRLRALVESPDAFGPSAAEASTEPDAYWQEAARRIAKAQGEVFIGWTDDAAIALVSAQVDEEGTGHIGAMWVDPDARGLGLGRRLLETACDCLFGHGSTQIRLWATEGNERAMGLYRRYGFVLTGESKPLREGSALRNLEMERSARPADDTEAVRSGIG